MMAVLLVVLLCHASWDRVSERDGGSRRKTLYMFQISNWFSSVHYSWPPSRLKSTAFFRIAGTILLQLSLSEIVSDF